MTLKEPKPKTIHKPIGAVIEAGKRNILYLLVFTCHYLYQLSNEISSLVRLTNQINVMAWASQFWPDRLPDCEFRLLFSAQNYWMSLLFTLLLLRIKKIKWRRRRCCVCLTRLTQFRGRETAFIVPARRVCIESIKAREFVICSCISVPNSPRNVSTQHDSLVWSLYSSSTLFYVRDRGGFRPASEWNLRQNPYGSTCRRLGNGRN